MSFVNALWAVPTRIFCFCRTLRIDFDDGLRNVEFEISSGSFSFGAVYSRLPTARETRVQPEKCVSQSKEPRRFTNYNVESTSKASPSALNTEPRQTNSAAQMLYTARMIGGLLVAVRIVDVCSRSLFNSVVYTFSLITMLKQSSMRK